EIANGQSKTGKDVPKPLPVTKLVEVGLILIGVVAILLIVIPSPPPPPKAIGSIAVLPFGSANSDPDTDYIADGITDNIIDRLSQLPNLKVISHTAVFHYKDRQVDPRTIGPELGVEAVLTVRPVRRNDALSISLELVNAKDNSYIWGEQYERKLSDLLALQR